MTQNPHHIRDGNNFLWCRLDCLWQCHRPGSIMKLSWVGISLAQTICRH